MFNLKTLNLHAFQSVKHWRGLMVVIRSGDHMVKIELSNAHFSVSIYITGNT